MPGSRKTDGSERLAGGLDLELAMRVALEAARAACEVLRQGQARLAELRFTTKSPGDVSTEIDRESERVIVSRLRAAFPEHAVLGEEGGASGASRWRWVIDPLDGTLNYLRGLPYYAVSLALEADGEALLGLVADPRRQEYFTAIKGCGAYLNAEPLRVSKRAQLKEAVIGTVLPPPSWPGLTRYLEQFCALAKSAAGLRRAGACALDLAYVAAGRLDGFFVVSLQRWDIAAGALLVQEAGGALADLDGAADPLAGNRLAAANPQLLPQLLARLAASAPQV